MTGATVYETDGSTREVEPKNGTDFKLEELNAIVHGFIEIIRLAPGAEEALAEGPSVAVQEAGRGKNGGVSPAKIMVINEEGKLDGLPYNEKATRIFCASFPGTGDYIVGPALVCDTAQVK
jgi:hypothetical protein